MANTTADRVPDQHAEVIAMVRVYAENAPDSLREHLAAALDSYEESGAWQTDDFSLYE